MLASSCSSANALLPIETCAPLPLVPLPVGHPVVVALLLLPVPVFPPPHAASAAGNAINKMARTLRFIAASSIFSSAGARWDCNAFHQGERPVSKQCQCGDHDGPHENDPVCNCDAGGNHVAEATSADEVPECSGSDDENERCPQSRKDERRR